MEVPAPHRQVITTPPPKTLEDSPADKEGGKLGEGSQLDPNFDVNEFFDFSTEASCGLEWVNKFLELDGDMLITDERWGVECPTVTASPSSCNSTR